VAVEVAVEVAGVAGEVEAEVKTMNLHAPNVREVASQAHQLGFNNSEQCVEKF